jgi:WD40 repeat protein
MKNLTIKDAHTDHINVLHECYDGTEMFSGSKDGIVKIWEVKKSLGNDSWMNEEDEAIEN